MMYRRNPTAAPDPIPVRKPSLEHGVWWTLRRSSLLIVLKASPTVARLFGSTPSGSGTDFSDTSANRSMAAACDFRACSSSAEPAVRFGAESLGDEGEADIVGYDLSPRVLWCGCVYAQNPSDIDGIIDFSAIYLGTGSEMVCAPAWVAREVCHAPAVRRLGSGGSCSQRGRV